MSRNYCVFNTFEQAQNYANAAFASWALTHEDNEEYAETTVRWDEPQKREFDGKYVVKLCPIIDNSCQIIEEHNSDWWGIEDRG